MMKQLESKSGSLEQIEKFKVSSTGGNPYIEFVAQTQEVSSTGKNPYSVFFAQTQVSEKIEENVKTQS